MSSADVSPVTRERPPEDGTERETLTGLLDFLRSTPIPPSTLTPAGLVSI